MKTKKKEEKKRMLGSGISCRVGCLECCYALCYDCRIRTKSAESAAYLHLLYATEIRPLIK